MFLFIGICYMLPVPPTLIDTPGKTLAMDLNILCGSVLTTSGINPLDLITATCPCNAIPSPVLLLLSILLCNDRFRGRGSQKPETFCYPHALCLLTNAAFLSCFSMMYPLLPYPQSFWSFDPSCTPGSLHMSYTPMTYPPSSSWVLHVCYHQ
jgi:hypothetical protein